MLRLKTSDDEIIEVEQYVLRHSTKIADYIKNNGGQIPEVLNLGTIDAPTLRGLIEYYEHFKDDQFDPANQEIPELTDFEQQFFQRALSTGLLTGMVNASYELGLMRLMNIACKFIARQASGKSPEEMRQFFQIPPDSDDDEDDEDDDNVRGFLGQLKLSDDK